MSEIVEIPQAGEGVECRLVEGFPAYAVGDDGSVWSRLPYPANKTQSGPHPWRPLKARRLKAGYCMVSFREGGKDHPEYVHRLVLRVFKGEPLPGQCAAHADGVRSNNRLSNLRWASRRENESDKKRHGTYYRRSNRITDEQARQIVELYRSTTATYAELASRFDTSVTNICNMLKGRTFRHLGLDLSGLPERKVSRGERGNAILSESQVREIRRRQAAGETMVSLAREHRVSFSTVQCICRGKRWKHIR